MLPESELKTWHREVAGVKYVCSTDPKLVQPDALNAAFGSDLLWWAHPLPEALLKRLVEYSLCFGLYVERSEPVAGDGQAPKLDMIGFARVVTDYATIGYLTDVYVLEGHQKRGLGTWLARCVDEVVSDWPELRGFLLLTSDPHAIKLYGKALGATDMRVSEPKLVLMQKPGRRGRPSPP